MSLKLKFLKTFVFFAVHAGPTAGAGVTIVPYFFTRLTYAFFGIK